MTYRSPRLFKPSTRHSSGPANLDLIKTKREQQHKRVQQLVPPASTKHPTSTQTHLDVTLEPKLDTRGVIVLLLLSMIGSAKGATASSSSKDPDLTSLLSRICLNPEGITSNKPDFPLAVQNKQFLPKSCLNPFPSKQCEDEENLFGLFQSSSDLNFKVTAKRAKNFKELMAERQAVQPEYYRIMGNLNSKQKTLFDSVIEDLSLAKAFAAEVNTLSELGSGRCAEFSGRAFMEILNHSIQSHEPLKVQLVAVTLKHSKQELSDHEFLLINSNLDAMFLDDEEDVADVLIQAKGIVCDPWNRELGEIGSLSNTLYKKNAQWDTLKIKNFDVRFELCAQLPEEAKKFICDELMKILPSPPFVCTPQIVVQDDESASHPHSLSINR